MPLSRENYKARIRFQHLADGIELSEGALERFADTAEERLARGPQSDPLMDRAVARAKREGRSLAEVFYEEGKAEELRNLKAG